jgi:predicted dehydrogenase
MGREITAVSAHGANLVHTALATVGDVDTGVTVLWFEGGGMGVTEWNRFSVYGYDTFAEVQGSEGAVRVDVPPRTQVLTLTRAGESHEYPLGFPDRFGPAYCAEIAAFARAVREGRPASPGVEDARWALHVALCARESFERGATVQVPPLAPLAARRD